MENQTIGQILLVIILILWLYKCIVMVEENRGKVVETWSGRFVRIISGFRGERAATKKDVTAGNAKDLGEFIDGKDDGEFEFILWPYQRISTYRLRKIVRRTSEEVNEKAMKNLAWGDPNEDTEVSLTQISISNHYRRQYTYEMHFDGLSTGKTKGAPGTAAQNVVMRVRLNVTTCSRNLYRTRYQENDGGKWLTTLEGVIMSALSEVFGARSFDDISDLRTEQLNNVKLKDGKTFLERIDEQMLEIKKLGQNVIDIDYLDDAVMPESQPFVDAKSKAVIASIEKGAAADQAAAKTLLMKPNLDAAKELMTLNQKNQKELKETKDATSEQKYSSLAQSQIRVFVDGGTSNGSSQSTAVDVDRIVTGVTNLEIVKEITEENNNGGGRNKSQKR